MKKYSVFNLYVITINNQKFICEPVIYGEEYREIFTRMKITLNEKFKVEILSDYYSLLERINYSSGKPLMLSKEDILRKYIDINRIGEKLIQTDKIVCIVWKNNRIVGENKTLKLNRKNKDKDKNNGKS